ncbi:MAG: DEAD/DEAH box helicase [Spirochaetales bacterium]|jgi:DNA excision repair protein ERCC-3|nr:DEAD/DEAH box helicase [Spirochaetales bacterium]
MNPAEKSLIVQRDSTLLLDVHSASYDEARAAISPFAELEKSPEHMHTYRISPLSLWNAASAGLDAPAITAALAGHSRYPVPENVAANIREILSRYGKIRLVSAGGKDGMDMLKLEINDPALAAEVRANRKLAKYLRFTEDAILLALTDRGTIKQELIRIGYPVQDEAPLCGGEPLPFSFRESTAAGRAFSIRDYQREAASALVADKRPGTGFGVVVLPCGAGKTIVGMAAMELLKTNTLILTTNIAAVHQWMDELLDKTTLPPDTIGEYSGEAKIIRPVTVATYQILVWRPAKEAVFPHFRLFRERGWGLIIYDEVHLLPAPMFRVTAEIQGVRRLGLTATLVREDGREEDVFSLVGPKRYDVPWKELEAKGWIAQATCVEIRLDLPEALKIPYAVADKRGKFRIACENPRKLAVVKEILENHPEDPTLIIGQYLDQLEEIAKDLAAPLITGKTPNAEREKIYGDFKAGRVRVIVVSKVANFAIDLPDASVAVQVSGSFGSRQEEAQRLGRILRPKQRNSWFYSILSRYTTEETFGENRQKFLTEQGYQYRVEVWEGT